MFTAISMSVIGKLNKAEHDSCDFESRYEVTEPGTVSRCMLTGLAMKAGVSFLAHIN